MVLQRGELEKSKQVLGLVVRLCVSDSTQLEITSDPGGPLTASLQVVVDTLLANQSHLEDLLLILIQLLNQELPNDLRVQLDKQQVLMSKLVLKYIQRSIQKVASLAHK